MPLESGDLFTCSHIPEFDRRVTTRSNRLAIRAESYARANRYALWFLPVATSQSVASPLPEAIVSAIRAESYARDRTAMPLL